MAFGIGDFTYEIEFNKDGATYVFTDPEDPSNTASTSLSKDDLEDGVTFDARQSTDQAYLKVSDELHRVRSERLQDEEKKAIEDRQAGETQTRERAEEHFANTSDVSAQVHHVEKDGTNVYESHEDGSPRNDQDNNAPASDDSKKKK